MRLKLEVEGVWAIFMTFLSWVVTFPPAQVGVPVFGTSHTMELHTLYSCLPQGAMGDLV